MQNDGSISLAKAFLRNKWVRLALIIDFLAIIAVIGILIWNATKTATINFSVAPVDAKIQIDGRGEYYNGSYQVHPGTHEITISHDGLTTKTFTMDLKSGYSATLTAFLSDNGNFDFYTLKDNYASFEKLTEIASSSNNTTTDHDTSAEQFISDFQQNYQLYQNALPTEIYNYQEVNGTYTTTQYIVLSASSECQKILCIEAKMVITDDQDSVSKFLTAKGFNLDFYEVKYASSF